MVVSLQIHYGPPFNELTKKTNEKINLNEEMSLKELIEYFKTKYGDEFKDLIFDKKQNGAVHKLVAIVINGRSYRHDKFFDTPIKHGSDIAFLYEYFGG